MDQHLNLKRYGYIAALVFGTELPINASLKADELVLLNWDQYLAKSVVNDFHKQTGHTIKTVLFDSDQDRDEILSSSSGKTFDLAVMSTVAVHLFGQNNYLLPIDLHSLNSATNIDPKWRDSCGNFGVPYFWGTVGIAYRTDKVNKAPESWAELMKPSTSLQGHIGMMQNFIDTLIPPLRLAGASIHTGDIDQLKAAFHALQSQKPYVLTYQYAISFQEESRDKDKLYLALVYSGDHHTLNNNEKGKPWRYTIPKEGTSLWVDCIAVLSSSTKRKAALQFIEFIHRPEIAALNANTLKYATTNRAAMKLIDHSLLNDPSIYPSEKIVARSEQYRIVSDSNFRQRNRILRTISK